MRSSPIDCVPCRRIGGVFMVKGGAGRGYEVVAPSWRAWRLRPGAALYVAGSALAAKNVTQRTFLLLRIEGLRGYFDAKSKRRPI